MRRTMIALSISAGAVIALSGCGDTTSTTTAADSGAPSMTVAVAQGFSCADIGGRFEVHGTDGRGSCVSADTRPACHIAPTAQDPNYLAEVTLTPPFPNGVVDYPFMIAMASNADCWRAP